MKRQRWILLSMLAVAAVVAATEWTVSCPQCGNSSEERGWATMSFLDAFSGAPAVHRGDTVTVNAGDGTKATYLLTSKVASIRWVCIDSCGPGDEVEGFIQAAVDFSNEAGYAAVGIAPGMTLGDFTLRALGFYTGVVTVGPSSTVR